MFDNKTWLNHKLGNYLKKMRLEAGLSQGDVASAMGYQSNQFISNVERGVCTPSPQIVYNFLKTYNVSNSKAVEDLIKIQTEYLNAEYRGKKLQLKSLTH